jgi:hypothetical protein
MFLKICEFTTGYPSQNDLPVVTVKKNPFKRLFSTKEVGEKQAFSIDKSRYARGFKGSVEIV